MFLAFTKVLALVTAFEVGKPEMKRDNTIGGFHWIPQDCI